MGREPTSTTDLRGGLTTDCHNQYRSNDQLAPLLPLVPLRGPPEVARSRPPQSLPQVQTQFPPFPVPQPSSPVFDTGAIAYLRYNDQTAGHNPPSPRLYSPGNAEDLRLTSAFSVASDVSPQYVQAPPLNIDEMWRRTPEPIQASSAYRPSSDRRHSVTPSVSAHIYEPGDTVVVAPLDPPTAEGHTQDPISPQSEYTSSPQTVRADNFFSPPSPITEVVEMLARSQDGFNDSGTWISTQSERTSSSSPVVMTAERVRVTPGPMSLSLKSPAYTISTGQSTGNPHGGSLPPAGATDEFGRGGSPPPPLLSLPPVQPLSLGKKRSAMGPS